MISCACVICALVLKDSDYLSVLFHLYDSDDDDDEEAERHKLAQFQRDERRRSVLFFCLSSHIYSEKDA